MNRSRPRISASTAIGCWRSLFATRVAAGRWFVAIAFISFGADEISVRAEEPTRPEPVAAPSRERMVSRRVAALLAASLPKLASPDTPREAAAPTTRDSMGAESGSDQAIVMAPFIVNESASQRRLMDAVARQQSTKAGPAFTFQNGGPLLDLGPAALKLKYDPKHKGFDILDFKF